MNKKSVYRNQEKTFCKIRAQIAEAFFIFAKCRCKLQKHFSLLQNAGANCRDVFHFCKMLAQNAEAFFIFAKCWRKLQRRFSFLQNAGANCALSFF